MLVLECCLRFQRWYISHCHPFLASLVIRKTGLHIQEGRYHQDMKLHKTRSMTLTLSRLVAWTRKASEIVCLDLCS